jgi:thioredoxin 1
MSSVFRPLAYGGEIMTSFRKAGIVVFIVALFATVVLIQQHQSRQSLNMPLNDNLDQVLPGVSSGLPRLVNLKTEMCIQCERMLPVLAELKRQFSDKFTVHTFDVGRNQRAGTAFGAIHVMPTLIFMNQAGQELYRFEGYMSKAEILERWQVLGVAI